MTSPAPSGRLAAVALTVILPLAAQAQDDAGGVRMLFELSQRLDMDSNADLVEDPDGATWRATGRLGFTLSSETRRDYLALGLSSTLNNVSAPGTRNDTAFELLGPDVTLSYRHDAGTARFQAGGAFNTRDITYLDSLDEVLDPESEALDTVDLEDLRRSGTRRTLSANSSLRFGIDTPTELGLSVNARAIDYDATGATLTDSQRYGARADMRLALAADLSLNSALSYSLYEEDKAPARETWGLDLGLVKSRPSGEIGLSASATRVEEGTRYRLSGSWSHETPGLNLALTLGATRSAEGELGLTGSARLARDLPLGQISAQLQRNYTAGSDDSETLVTTFRTGYGTALTPLTDVNFNVSYASTDSNTGDSRRAEFGAGIQHRLTEDWFLGLGYRRIALHPAGTDWIFSDNIYLNVNRSLEVRF